MTGYTGTRLADALREAGLGDWHPEGDAIRARYLTRDFATGLALTQRIGEAAEEANHHPDLTLTYPHLDVRLTSHDAGAVTERDLRLAGVVSALAREAGIEADPQEGA